MASARKASSAHKIARPFSRIVQQNRGGASGFQAAGATGNPAVLVFANRLAKSDRPNLGYAMIFPSMTIVKIIAVQILLHLYG